MHGGSHTRREASGRSNRTTGCPSRHSVWHAHLRVTIRTTGLGYALRLTHRSGKLRRVVRKVSPAPDAWPVELGRHLHVADKFQMPAVRTLPAPPNITHHNVTLRAMRLRRLHAGEFTPRTPPPDASHHPRWRCRSGWSRLTRARVVLARPGCLFLHQCTPVTRTGVGGCAPSNHPGAHAR